MALGHYVPFLQPFCAKRLKKNFDVIVGMIGKRDKRFARLGMRDEGDYDEDENEGFDGTGDSRS